MSRQAWALLMLLSVIWGASFLFIEMALVVMGPVSLVFFRVLIGALTLFFYLRLAKISLPKSLKFWTPVTLMGALNNAIPFSLIAYGQLFITGGMASIINANTAFFGVVVAALFIADERLSWSRFLGVLIGISGVVIVAGPAELLALDFTSIGQLAVILATLSYAFASVWGKLRLQGYHGAVTAFGMMATASLLLLPVMLIKEGVPHFAIDGTMIIVAIGLGVIGTAGAYLLYFKILALAGASNLMLVTIIVPVFAVLLDGLVLAQYLPVEALIGFVVIAIGLAVMDGRLGQKIIKRP